MNPPPLQVLLFVQSGTYELLRQPGGFEGLGSILVVVHAGEQSSPHRPNLGIGPSKFEVGGAPRCSVSKGLITYPPSS